MDKEDVLHVYNGILLRHRRSDMTPLAATCMDLEIIILSEVNQTREEQALYDATYMWNLKK